MVACPKCGHPNRDTARFCANCSGPLTPAITPSVPVTPGRICPNCQAGNSSAARFCQICGQLLLPPLPTSIPSTPQPGLNISPSTPQPGQLLTGHLQTNSYLANRYLIWHKVGQGGMGAVYKAVDTRLGQQICAIKEMSSANLPTMAERQMAVANFEREAEMLAKLNHPNLPRVTDHFSEGGRHYMVMEFIEGQTLAERLENDQPLTEAEVRSIAEQLCIVLNHLHNQSVPIIFRDLKPGNIMLQPDGRVKLIDFGIVRFFKTGKKLDTQLLGTPGYAAPEATSGQTDARSDIYSLGMTLYCLLTAKDPPLDLSKFQPRADLAACASPELSRVILKALAIKRDDRWASADEIRKALPVATSIPRSGGSTSSGQSTSGGGGIRGATQRLTHTLALRMKQMSNEQLAGLTIGLIVGVGLVTWLVGPWIAENLPWLWRFLPLYYMAGPFAYAVSKRKGAALLVHTPLHIIIAGLTWPAFNFGPHLLAGLIAGVGMEGVLSHSGNEKTRLWYYVAASALAIILAMAFLTFTTVGYFDVIEIFGAGLAGAMGYGASEAFWGVREGVKMDQNNP